ncbi:MAG: hypothetical protein KDK34_05220, partial [Leptospiraceae bacterium]|nr:hypothetical protein [Leptospiraceae bacterium]
GYVQFSRNVTRTVQIRVERPELPADLAMAERVPAYMEVALYGTQDSIDFEFSNFRMELEPTSRLKTGENTYKVRLLPALPEGIRAEYQTELNIKLDRSRLRELPVIPVLDLDLQPDRALGYVSTDPEYIVVRGPYSIVAEMERLYTEPLRMDVLQDRIGGDILIRDLPDLVEPAPDQPLQVQVNATLYNPDGTDYVVLEDMPVRCMNPVPGMVMKTTTVNLHVEGDPEDIRKDQFQLAVFCPVFFDSDERIKPQFVIEDLPVQIVRRPTVPGIRPVFLEPSVVVAQFEKAVVQPPSEVQQGIQDHHLPPDG